MRHVYFITYLARTATCMLSGYPTTAVAHVPLAPGPTRLKTTPANKPQEAFVSTGNARGGNENPMTDIMM